jgi:hypothetical protein
MRGARSVAAQAQKALLVDSTSTGIGKAVSPFYARLPDGRSVEVAYQQAKGYSNWKEGKGKGWK